MSKPAARIGDMHVCPMVTPGTPPIPHVGGPVTGPGVPTVLIGGMPAAVMGDMCTCVGPPDTIVLGSTGVLIGGKPAARMGDMCAHGGTIVVGCPTVLIGEVSPGGPVPPAVMGPIMQEFKKQVNKAAGGDGAVAEKAMEVAQTEMALLQAAENGETTALIGGQLNGESEPATEISELSNTGGYAELIEEFAGRTIDALANTDNAGNLIKMYGLLPGIDTKQKVEIFMKSLFRRNS